MIPYGIVLDSTTKSLVVKLGAAGTIPVTVNYYDIPAQEKNDFQPLRGGCSLTTTSGTTYVTACEAPRIAGTVRVINYICVHDSDAGSETVTVAIDDNGTQYIQVVMTLATTESLVWTPESSWQVTT